VILLRSGVEHDVGESASDADEAVAFFLIFVVEGEGESLLVNDTMAARNVGGEADESDR